MLKPIKFANAVAVVSVAAQVIYTLKMTFVPSWMHYAMNAMMPGYDLTSIQARSVDWFPAFLGFIMVGVVAWVLTFAVIWLYNRWEK